MTEHPAAPMPAEERLRENLRRGRGWPDEHLRDLDAALAEARAAARKEVLDEVRTTCKEWGHTDDWNVESIYVSTLFERLDSLSTDTREERDDPISDSRQPEDGPPPGRWPR